MGFLDFLEVNDCYILRMKTVFSLDFIRELSVKMFCRIALAVMHCQIDEGMLIKLTEVKDLNYLLTRKG